MVKHNPRIHVYTNSAKVSHSQYDLFDWYTECVLTIRLWLAFEILSKVKFIILNFCLKITHDYYYI